MSVNALHPLYTAHSQQAQRVRDAVAGSDAVKARGTDYLPNPDPSDPQRYADYKERAVWLGVTSRTHNGMLGAVFRKAPSLELPAAIEYLEEDADGSGMSLEQFAKLGVSHVMQAGRHGILVDFPEAEDGLTREQTQGLRATLRHYESASIINWKREGELLSLVVLQETYDKEALDEFETDADVQYRVLRLEDEGYTQQVYRDGVPVGEKITPRMGNGAPWPIIPFQFVGAVNNDETPDKPMLIDIADLNLAHYRNSADWEESAFTVGQAMPHVDIGTTDEQTWNSLNPGGLKWGSRVGVITQGGKLELVQAQPNTMPMEGMLRKEAQMLAIGARLIEQKGGNETAEAVRARSGAENSSLSTVATNVSDALRNCLQWALTFMARKDEEFAEGIEIELNQQFYAEDTDPQMVMARIAELDRGLIAKQDYRTWRRKTGGIEPERTDEDIDADVESGGTDIGAI